LRYDPHFFSSNEIKEQNYDKFVTTN
jgi:hypothetical protein